MFASFPFIFLQFSPHLHTLTHPHTRALIRVRQIGIYLSKMMTCERSMLFFFEEHFTDAVKRCRTSRSKLVEYLFSENGTGVRIHTCNMSCHAMPCTRG
jgi:hypothetical protein